MTEQSLFWTTNDTGDGVESGYTATQWFSLWRALYTGHTVNAGGVAPNYANQLAVSGTTSPITVATGAALVYGIPFFNDAALTVAIPTPVSQTRIDRIVVRAIWSAQTVRIIRIAGTEGAGTPPNLVQSAGDTWDIPLATVSITAGGSITVTDAREYVQMVAPGGVVASLLTDNAVTTAKVANSAVTNAKLADMTQTTIKGRAVGSGTGAPTDLTAAQVVALIATGDGTGSGLDADLLDGQHASAFALSTHNHDTLYAAIGHNHDSTYAAINHLHTGVYALTTHNHDSTYAATAHNHDTLYAASNHVHTGVYALTSHNHDGVYSPTTHTHASYAAVVHNHDGVYSPTSHTHSGYAATTHNHDGVYSPTSHTHSQYAATSHNHDSTYATTSHTHAAYATTSHNHDSTYATTSHTHGTSGIDNAAITNAKLANMADGRIKGRAVGAGSGDPTDLTAAQVVAILTTGDGSGSGYDADTLDGKHATEFAATTHNHDSVYAATTHNHDSVYAATTHNHDSVYAATTHNHDGVYAATSHNHDGTYAATTHNHDSVYAATTHSHGTTDIADDAVTNAKLADMAEGRIKGRAASAGTGDPVDLTASQVRDIVKLADGSGSGLDADTLDGVHASGFSAASHTHSTYSLIGHTHSQYSVIDHLHDGTYALTSHTHTGYAATSHTHSGYSLTSHTHTGYAATSHTHAADATVTLSMQSGFSGSASSKRNLAFVTVAGSFTKSTTGSGTVINHTAASTVPRPAFAIYGVAMARSDSHIRQITARANGSNSLELLVTNATGSVTYDFSVTYVTDL